MKDETTLTYPREWHRVSRWASKPDTRMFDRETENCLFAGNRRHLKQTAHERWYPTLEDAQAAIDKRNADKAEQERRARIRDAAPDLLEALEGVMPLLEKIEDAELVGDEGCLWPVELARDAIAKARGSSQ